MQALQLSREILSKEIIAGRASVKAFTLCVFVTLTALGAYVRIPLPFTPVPITLQTFFVLLSGAVLGEKWGTASQASYLFLGVLGFPVFAGANFGAAYLLGPTGGYLIGFVVSSWLAGALIHRQNQLSLGRIALAMFIASLAGIYLFGVLGLSLFLRCSLSQALALGFFPFIPGCFIKIIGASLIYRQIGGRCREIFV